MRRNGRWGQIGIEQHISTSRLVQVLTQCQLPHQRSNAIELSLMLQLLDIDIVQGQGSVAEIVEDKSEQLGVSVDEDGAVFVLERLNASTQEASEECVLDLGQSLSACAELGSSNIEVDNLTARPPRRTGHLCNKI